jgi:RNA ligase (TIGR02306 family)
MSSLNVKVTKVKTVTKHPNADRLDVITMKDNDWNCIVGLNNFKVGDEVIFIPPDSIVPTNLIEQFKLEYLRKNGRIESQKLRGFLSQGLVLPNFINAKVGDDVAEQLGITKWMPPEPGTSMRPMATSKKKLNPLFDRYTDIENIKNYPNVFSEDDLVIVTEKIHGCNARYGILPLYNGNNNKLIKYVVDLFNKLTHRTHEFVYGSHNVQIQNKNRKGYYSSDVWGNIYKKYDLKNKLEKLKLECGFDSIILYGEIYGEGIQDLTYNEKEHKLRLFDIKVNGKYVDYDLFMIYCSELHLNLETVPEIYEGLFKKELLNDLTDGTSIIEPNQIREGCVIKSLKEENDLKIGRKILKSVSSDYLLRKGNKTEFK